MTILDKKMTTSTIQVQILKKSWLIENAIYFPIEHVDFFPSDALRERHKGAAPGKAVTFDYGEEQSTCDIVVGRSVKGKINRIRPSVRGHAIENFLKTADVNDFVTITKVDSRKFEIRLVKANDTTL